jgi:predicted enzyme related to lactoylglutathione lyase
MKITDYRWIGMLVHDYKATCDFFDNMLGLKRKGRDEEKQIAMYQFWGPDGQFYCLQQFDD